MALVALVGGLFAVSYGVSGAGLGAGHQHAIANSADSDGTVTTDGYDWN